MCTAQAGGFMQMVAADRSSKANARIMKKNAQMAAFQANMVRNRGRMEEQRQRISTKRALGTARASIAANGFDVGSGSALDVVGDIAGFGELDALTIRYNTEMDARALELKSDQYQMMAVHERQKGKFSLLAGFTSMAGNTLLTSATEVHPRWYKYG